MNYKEMAGSIKTLFIAGVLCGALVAYSQNTLTLNVGQATHTINRALYGALLEDWGRDIYNGLYQETSSSIPNTNGMRNDIIAAFREAGISCLEWPGGCKVWTYRWREGIGPKSSRPGGEMTNGMGTAEYFQLCELINGEPYITCNMRSAPASEMADWLNYIDSTPAWKSSLKYWKIGNEEWGGCGTAITVNEFITKYTQYVNAIPASYSGKLVRIAEGGRSDQQSTWLNSVMGSLMGKMEAVSYHFYTVTDWSAKGPSMNFTEDQYYAQLQVAYIMERNILSCETVMNTHDPNYTVGLFVDEWGAWYDEIPGMGLSYQQNTVRDAVIAVMHLNIFNNHCRRVKMALSAQPINVIHSLFLTQNPPTTALVKTPTFYVYKMLKPHQNAKMIPATLTCGTAAKIPVISASASIDSAGAIHISLGNIHATASQILAITLSNTSESYTASGEIVNGPAITSYNDFNTAEQVNIKSLPTSNFTLNGNTLNVTLPTHSVIMMTLTPASATVPSPRNVLGRGFSIKALTNGDVVVKLKSAAVKSVSLNVYSSDGRLIKGVARQAEGTDRIVWRPECVSRGTGLYFVKITVDGASIVEPLLLTQR